MKRSLFKILIVVLLIFLPVILHQTYRWMTALPSQITIAAGQPSGRYYGMAQQLKAMLEQRLPIKVKVLQTNGSLENLELLRRGEVELGFYQPGTDFTLAEENQEQPNLPGPADDPVCFIANLYSQVLHVIVPADSEIKSVGDLKGHRVAIGTEGSGDLAASLPMLRHMQLDQKQFEAASLSYQEIQDEFAQGTLDAALVTVGVEAPILHDLLATGNYRVLEIPFTDALTRKESHFYVYEIPAGMFRTQAPIVPPVDLTTVACSAHLLTRESLPDPLIAEVTEIILHENFSRQMHLNELFAAGHEFAQDKQGFPIHSGADHVYNPELKPFLNSDFVEATEGMRSFLVSMLIAGYLLFRWFHRRRTMAKEHRLDRYIRQLLAIENRQMQLDGNQGDDGLALQVLLDEVTSLRQEALQQFSAHEMNEDRATDTFLEMCHALSDKINAKLLGWKIDRLAEKIENS